MLTDDLAARIAQLESRLRHHDDQRAIQDLMYEYGYSFDDGRMDDFINCFTEDCEGEYLPFAQGFKGRAEILKFAEAVKNTFPRITQTFHFTVSPLIQIKGDTATSRWHWMNPSTVEDSPGKFVSAWQFGLYEMDYRREADGWKIRRNKVTYLEVFDLTKGYAGQPMLILGSGNSASEAEANSPAAV